MGWLGDSSHRGQGCQVWTAVGLPPRYPLPKQQALQWRVKDCHEWAVHQKLVPVVWYKKLAHVSVNLVPVFFWYKFLAHNRTQLYSITETVQHVTQTVQRDWTESCFCTTNCDKLASNFSCMFLLQVWGTSFLNVCRWHTNQSPCKTSDPTTPIHTHSTRLHKLHCWQRWENNWPGKLTGHVTSFGRSNCRGLSWRAATDSSRSGLRDPAAMSSALNSRSSRLSSSSAWNGRCFVTGFTAPADSTEDDDAGCLVCSLWRLRELQFDAVSSSCDWTHTSHTPQCTLTNWAPVIILLHRQQGLMDY